MTLSSLVDAKCCLNNFLPLSYSIYNPLRLLTHVLKQSFSIGVSNLFLNEFTHVSKHRDVKYRRIAYEFTYILRLIFFSNIFYKFCCWFYYFFQFLSKLNILTSLHFKKIEKHILYKLNCDNKNIEKWLKNFIEMNKPIANFIAKLKYLLSGNAHFDAHNLLCMSSNIRFQFVLLPLGSW